MTTKLCSICKVNPSRISKRKRNNGYCRECNCAYGRENYRKNKERYYAQSKKRDRQLDELINSYKDKPCMDCGVAYPFYVMDLDHRDPTTKSWTVSKMRRKRMKFALIEEELAKCDVVCSNCHRERTNKQNPARYTKA